MSQRGKSLSEFVECFSYLKDKRLNRRKQHPLINVIIISLCSILCGERGWLGMAEFGKEYREWLATFLDLSQGTPSKDTFRRVFMMLEPNAFYDCFLKFIKTARDVAGQVVAFDGKTLRHAFEKAGEKSNEITAFPKLLDLLHLKGAIVTADALNCQTAIVEKIIDNEADYVLAVKSNQKGLYQHIKSFIERHERYGFGEVVHQFEETVDKDHGRLEIRKYWQLKIEWKETQAKWRGLKTIGFVEAHRTVGEKTSVERRYYINSLDLDVKIFARAVRAHWSIENGLHYVLDVIFNEDDCRIREGIATD